MPGALEDLNPPPAVHLRDEANPQAIPPSDPVVVKQSKSPNDERRYGPAHPSISTENPTQLNGITYSNLTEHRKVGGGHSGGDRGGASSTSYGWPR
jgi:hypothetical protein